MQPFESLNESIIEEHGRALKNGLQVASSCWLGIPWLFAFRKVRDPSSVPAMQANFICHARPPLFNTPSTGKVLQKHPSDQIMPPG
jgi:hypothetical protein